MELYHLLTLWKKSIAGRKSLVLVYSSTGWRWACRNRVGISTNWLQLFLGLEMGELYYDERCLTLMEKVDYWFYDSSRARPEKW